MKRMASWLLISLGLTVIIALVAPYQLGVTAYKLSLITTAAWLGYWLDRAIFPGCRPHELIEKRADAARFRRAIIVAAVVIAVSLGA